MFVSQHSALGSRASRDALGDGHQRISVRRRRSSIGEGQVSPPTAGRIIAIPQVGGLHHRYERTAA